MSSANNNDRKRARSDDDNNEVERYRERSRQRIGQQRLFSPFMIRKKDLYYQAMTELNTWFQGEMEKYVPRLEEPRPNVEPKMESQMAAGHLTFVTQEYIRIQSDIREQYDRPVGDVVMMGSNDVRQMGRPAEVEESETNLEKQPQYPPHLVEVLPPNKMIQVASGGVHTVALTVDGHVYTWGSNDDGDLSRPTETEADCAPALVRGFIPSKSANPRFTHDDDEDGQIVAIATGESTTLFLSINGNMYVTGMFKDSDQKFRVVIPGPDGKIDDPRGHNERPLHLPLPQKVRKVFAGSGPFNAALLADGSTLLTWGMGTHGELARSADMTAPDGNGNYDLQSILTDSKGEFKLDIIARKFLTPSPVIFGRLPHEKKTVVSVACGDHHLLVVARDPGEYKPLVYASGSNGYGQLGMGSIDRKVIHELTVIPFLEDKNIVKVAAGASFSLALDHYGIELYSFGRSDYGQLGLFDSDKTSGDCECTPQRVAFPGTKTVRIKDIFASEKCSMATDYDGDVYTWGFNELLCTGHNTKRDMDVLRPLKLNLGDLSSPNYMVQHASGGGQHTSMLVTMLPSKKKNK